MAAPSSAVVLDDRLLIEELLVGIRLPSDADVFTTSLWYFRTCRAALRGAGGHLSGPFATLAPDQQQAAIANLLLLPDAIGLVDPRHLVPVMADIARRHPELNVLNLEAVAAGAVTGGVLWLSAGNAAGVLPQVLRDEGVEWRQVAVD